MVDFDARAAGPERPGGPDAVAPALMATAPTLWDHLCRYQTEQERRSLVEHSRRVCEAVVVDDHRNGIAARSGRRVYRRSAPRRYSDSRV